MQQYLSRSLLGLNPFDRESEVRTYCRRMPAVFDKAKNAEVWDEDGRRYIDFFSSCGAVNYGHNNPQITESLLSYIGRNGITSSLDLHTVAKRRLISEFEQTILWPRRLNYKFQFPGPTGTNAVEAAIKLARKVTGRQIVVAFSNGFHGMTLGALALTGNSTARAAAGVPLTHCHRLPFDGFQGASAQEFERFERLVSDPSSGYEAPAAFIVETVQGEGGLNVASNRWLRALERIAARLGALLIVDDIQAGCGRTGEFFSFERAHLQPDIICLSKSIGGNGLPLSLVLMKPELDVWSPGEHTGTFRGNNLAFVTATAALEFWRDPQFKTEIAEKALLVKKWLAATVQEYSHLATARGRGLFQGIAFNDPDHAKGVAAAAFENGILIETCGPHGEVVKIMPALTIEPIILLEGLAQLKKAVDRVLVAAGKGPTRKVKSRINSTSPLSEMLFNSSNPVPYEC